MSERYTSDVTKDYMRALTHRDSTKLQLEGCEAELRKYGNELGAIIAPKDMVETEIIGVWHRIDRYAERCFTVSKHKDGYAVYLREGSRKVDDK